jgi:hypothetical protein
LKYPKRFYVLIILLLCLLFQLLFDVSFTLLFSFFSTLSELLRHKPMPTPFPSYHYYFLVTNFIFQYATLFSANTNNSYICKGNKHCNRKNKSLLDSPAGFQFPDFFVRYPTFLSGSRLFCHSTTDVCFLPFIRPSRSLPSCAVCRRRNRGIMQRSRR